MNAAVEKGIVYRRNDPGTKREDWCKWPDMPFEEVRFHFRTCAFYDREGDGPDSKNVPETGLHLDRRQSSVQGGTSGKQNAKFQNFTTTYRLRIISISQGFQGDMVLILC